MSASRITKLTLIQKMIISFVVSGLFILTALIYSVYSMGSMHRMEEVIAQNDLGAATITISLNEIILAQERLIGKYRILRQAEFRDLYQGNAAKFTNGLAQLKKMNQGPAVDLLATAYTGYAAMAEKLFADQPVPALELGRATKSVERAIESLRSEQQFSLERKLEDSDKQEARTLIISIGLAIGGVATALVIAFMMIYSFASSIGKLQRATHRIADGDFDHDPGIPMGDEIGALAQDFSRMAERLKQLELISLDASPLTRLPGNIAIERSLNRRLKENETFVMCYMDLDNFKSYNDRYGYIKASDMLKESGRIIHNAVLRLNDPEAFVGHIGGDDFIAIVSSGMADRFCRDVIDDLDAMIPTFYSDEDRLAGSINGVDRYGVQRVFPIVSISIAALECHPEDYASAAEIATAAARVKDHIKVSSGSNYIIVREAEAV